MSLIRSLGIGLGSLAVGYWIGSCQPEIKNHSEPEKQQTLVCSENFYDYYLDRVDVYAIGDTYSEVDVIAQPNRSIASLAYNMDNRGRVKRVDQILQNNDGIGTHYPTFRPKISIDGKGTWIDIEHNAYYAAAHCLEKQEENLEANGRNLLESP